MANVLLLGDKHYENELSSETIKQALWSLSPKTIMTDLSQGWTIEATKVAVHHGYSSLMGIFPFAEIIGTASYKEEREKLDKYVRNRLVFNKTYLEFKENPQPYIDYIQNHVDLVLTFTDAPIRLFHDDKILNLKEKKWT